MKIKENLLTLSDNIIYSVGHYSKGTPVLLLHGFSGNKSSWQYFIESIDQEFMFIAPDLLGHGKTSAPKNPKRYAIEKCAKDLKEILKKMQIEKVHCVGYSMGGRLALAFSILYPNYLKSLTLINSSPGLLSINQRKIRKKKDCLIAKKIETKGTTSFVDFWEKTPLFIEQSWSLSPKKLEEQRKTRLNNSKQGLIGSLLGMGTGIQPYYGNKLVQLTIPVLLIGGKRDKKYKNILDKMFKKISNCEMHIIENCGHAVHIEQPLKFAKIFVDFIMKHTGKHA